MHWRSVQGCKEHSALAQPMCAFNCQVNPRRAHSRSFGASSEKEEIGSKYNIRSRSSSQGTDDIGRMDDSPWATYCTAIPEDKTRSGRDRSADGVSFGPKFACRRYNFLSNYRRTSTDADDFQFTTVNSMKQASAFPPNFIHSLDATHMMLTALECRVRGSLFRYLFTVVSDIVLFSRRRV